MLQTRKIGGTGKFFLATMLVLFVMGMAMTMVSVSAEGNWKDTLFKSAGTSSGEISTKARNKRDYSSSYAYNMKSTCELYTEVLGCADDESSPKATEIYAGGDCTYGAHKKIPIGAAYYLPNLVKEKGYKSAILHFKFPSVTIQSLYVWWSPDSI